MLLGPSRAGQSLSGRAFAIQPEERRRFRRRRAWPLTIEDDPVLPFVLRALPREFGASRDQDGVTSFERFLTARFVLEGDRTFQKVDEFGVGHLAHAAAEVR